jgi:hypothetical protein
MEQPFTVKRSRARAHMFACRLSGKEYAALEELLSCAYCSGESQSDLFRSILLELRGRLSRDFLKHLKYKSPSWEPSVREGEPL